MSMSYWFSSEYAAVDRWSQQGILTTNVFISYKTDISKSDEDPHGTNVYLSICLFKNQQLTLKSSVDMSVYDITYTAYLDYIWLKL